MNETGSAARVPLAARVAAKAIVVTMDQELDPAARAETVTRAARNNPRVLRGALRRLEASSHARASHAADAASHVIRTALAHLGEHEHVDIALASETRRNRDR